MGTSQSNPGSPPGQPLVPPWVPDIPPLPDGPGDEGDDSEQDRPNLEPPNLRPQEIAPPARWRGANVNLGNFAQSGDTVFDYRVLLARNGTGSTDFSDSLIKLRGSMLFC